ncbi:RNA-binding transcriptional accessory protein, partial [Clostridium perfringens]|nr:RNA-binding transcriptional accessory protein [Clostridium perfringens]
PKSKIELAEKELVRMITENNVELIAIGNGTASRETEQFVANVIKKYQLNAQFIIVNEAGASVYSASEIARNEFPEFQVEERSAVSIGRRVQDPLSELVKIDPKSIGVGQYQHDVNQKELEQALTFVVETA